MGQELLRSQRMSWPPYFQPRRGQENPLTEESVRSTASLVDMFYFRDVESQAVELVVVLGCLGGGLTVITGEAISTLSSDLQGQVGSVEASRRGQFRAITAGPLYLMTLEAVEQQVQVEGFNDAVYLYGQMQARLSADQGRVEITPLANEGRLTVGRLDVLHAYRESLAHVFQNPYDADERMVHLLLPGAPISDIQQGRGLVLVYPVLDPQMFDRADNTVIVMRIVYDLLSRLQAELSLRPGQSPLAATPLPVPSRRRLEVELRLAGYDIEGDEAIRSSDPRPPGQEEPGLLDRLRRMAARWTAERMTLPPQATPQDYRAIIRRVLPAIATPADDRMMQTLSASMQAQASPAEKSAAQPEPLPSPPRSPHSSPAPRRPAGADRADWARDFERPAVPSRRRAAQPEWWRDFAGEAADSTQAKAITSRTDWLVDLQAEHGLLPASSAGGPEPAGRDDWSQDFQELNKPKPTASPPASEWEGDFK